MTLPASSAAALHMSESAAEYRSIQAELDEVVLGVLASGSYVHGEHVRGIERELAARCSSAYGIAAGSGITALLIAIKALGIGPGDEVIAPAYTCISTTSPITHAGATIRLADIEPETLNLGPDGTARALTARTRALLPVHMHGYPAPMDALGALAQAHNLLILEDAALAVGARLNGRPCGSLGHAAAISFAPSKVLAGIGWGGMVLTDDAAVARRARQLADHGPDPDDPAPETEADLEGYNAQLSAIQAAALRVKLRYLDGWVARRRQIAAYYDETCDRLGVRRLRAPAGAEPSYRAYVILAPERDAVQARLQAEGVHAVAYFTPPLHMRPIYRRLGYQPGDFPVAEALCAQLLCLPCHPHLTDAEVEHVAHVLARAVGAGP